MRKFDNRASSNSEHPPQPFLSAEDEIPPHLQVRISGKQSEACIKGYFSPLRQPPLKRPSPIDTTLSTIWERLPTPSFLRRSRP